MHLSAQAAQASQRLTEEPGLVLTRPSRYCWGSVTFCLSVRQPPCLPQVRAGAGPLQPDNTAVIRQRSPRWLTVGSRAGTPDGSLRAFAWDHVADAQSLSSPLQASLCFLHRPVPAVPLACLAAHFPKGRTTGLPRSVCVPMNGVGLACSPVAFHLR